MTMRSFGLLEDGRSVEAITLEATRGLEVEVLTYGAILHFDRLQDYVVDRAYVSSIVGRFGNRIAKAAFTIDEARHKVSANEGVNHLHGGTLGFGKRLWRVLDVTGTDRPRVLMGYALPDGEEGYPGELDARVEFVVRPNSLAIELTARSDAPTPVNLTYHPYFNLAGPFGAPAVRLPQRAPPQAAGRQHASAARYRRRLRSLLGDRRGRGLRLRAFEPVPRSHADAARQRTGAAVLQWPVPVARASNTSCRHERIVRQRYARS